MGGGAGGDTVGGVGVDSTDSAAATTTAAATTFDSTDSTTATMATTAISRRECSFTSAAATTSRCLKIAECSCWSRVPDCAGRRPDHEVVVGTATNVLKRDRSAVRW